MASELEVGKVKVGTSTSTDTITGFNDSQAAIVGGDNVGLALQSTNSNKSARVRFFDHSGNQDATVGFDNSNSNLFMGTGTATHLAINTSGAVSIPSASGNQIALTVKGGNNLVDNIALNITNQAGDSGTNIRNNGQLFASTLATFSGGINLGDTTLSNYKEGTFTPTISKDNFSTTISSPDVATGRYVRVGKMCYIIVYWYKTACPTTTGGSAYKIGALPFSFVEDSPYQFLNAGYVIFNGNSFNTSPYRWQVTDPSAVTLYGTQSATNWTSGALEFSACGVLEIA